MERLKKKWKITSNFQLLVILVVFAITGSASLVVSTPILDFIGFSKESINPWLYHPLRLILIFPVYQVLIIVIGTIFGQFKFFWDFEKKMLVFLGFKRFKE
tara:strand:+ start:268 stop:570 length:303 start_codon:yes stop_codon:yes gene_type:complete